MMYLACSRLIYAGSEIVPSSLISNSKSLRIRVEIEWGGCSPPFEGWKKPQNIDFSSIFVIGKSKVTFVEVSNKFLDLGYFDLPSDGGWEGGFYVDIPLIPEIRDLVYRNGAKGRLRLDFGGPGIIIGLPDIRQLFASLVFYVPEHSYVLNPKPTNKTDRSIQLEEEIVEEITKIDLVKEGAKEESKKLLQDVRQFLQGGKIEDAAIALRNFLMNDLTEIDKGKPEGERRRLKGSILNARLEGYEGQAKENIEELCNTHIRKIIDQNLDILHKYVKDKSVIQTPDYSTLVYVYRNVLNLMRYLDIGDI